MRFYIEILRPDGCREFFDFVCDTQSQADTYADDKARAYNGRVVVCRPAKAQ